LYPRFLTSSESSIGQAAEVLRRMYENQSESSDELRETARDIRPAIEILSH